MSDHYLHNANSLKRGSAAHEVVGEVIDLGVGAGASFGFGYLTGKYRDKTLIAGRVPLDLGVGLALSLGSVALDLTGTLSGFSGLVKDVGRAGVGAWAHTHGVGAGTAASGIKRALVEDKDLAKLRAAVPNAVILGATGAAPHGAFLSSARLNELAKSK